MLPEVVIRPIFGSAWFCSVNQRAPSGPVAIPPGWLAEVGSGNSVMLPEVVTRPILLPESSVNHSAPSGPTAIVLGKASAVGIGYSLISAEAATGTSKP